MTPLLQVNNLSIAFSNVFVVKNVSFSVQKGTTLGVVGESGSGKTTLALSLIGLLPRSAAISGEVFYEGKILKPQQLRGTAIGYIFQDPHSSLNPTMKIGKQIQEGIKRYEPHLTSPASKEKVLDLLEQVEIPNPEKVISYYPHMLSGGMKQRVVIAIALSQNPQLLIADEPTTALDVSIQTEILNLLKTLQQKKKMSILFITHNLGLLPLLCDEVMVMYQGEIIEYKAIRDVFSQPSHEYTKKLLSLIPTLVRSP